MHGSVMTRNQKPVRDWEFSKNSILEMVNWIVVSGHPNIASQPGVSTHNHGTTMQIVVVP